jgi:hypothetical protein
MRTLGTFLAAAAMLGPVAASAQRIADVERQLLPFQRETLRDVGADFWRLLAALRAEEDKLRGLKADILFGLSGDEAGKKSLYKLNTGIALSRADGPVELEVQSKLGLQLRDGVLQEDVTSLRITYDYHLTERWQTFAFAERFSDSFLSIQQRYEIGFGARFARKIGLTGEGEAVRAQVNSLKEGFTRAKTLGTPEDAQSRTAIADASTRFDAAAANLLRAVQDRYAQLTVGLAVSVFAEIERADLDVVSVPAAGASSSSDSLKLRFTPPGQQRYRVTFRPTLQWQTNRAIKVRLHPYLKAALDPPNRFFFPDSGETRDYRLDILSELVWSLGQAQTGLENVEFVLTFNHFFDKIPPRLTPATIAAEMAKGRVFNVVEAEKTHRVTALALRFRW